MISIFSQKLISHSFFSAYVNHGVKASVKKKGNWFHWFSRKFCVCVAAQPLLRLLRRGQILPHSLLMTVGHYLCSLLLWGNPKWGTSRDQWNSALNYLIYWSSSKTLKTICVESSRAKAFSTNLRTKQKTQQSFLKKSYLICILFSAQNTNAFFSCLLSWFLRVGAKRRLADYADCYLT